MAERAFSVTIDDCEVQTFRAGGKGGQHQNKTESGVRVIHHLSGARGEARDERSQYQNKRLAFTRMVNSNQFQLWIKRTLYGYDRAEREVAEMMKREQDFKTEFKRNGKWVVE